MHWNPDIFPEELHVTRKMSVALNIFLLFCQSPGEMLEIAKNKSGKCRVDEVSNTRQPQNRKNSDVSGLKSGVVHIESCVWPPKNLLLPSSYVESPNVLTWVTLNWAWSRTDAKELKEKNRYWSFWCLKVADTGSLSGVDISLWLDDFQIISLSLAVCVSVSLSESVGEHQGRRSLLGLFQNATLHSRCFSSSPHTTPPPVPQKHKHIYGTTDVFTAESSLHAGAPPPRDLCGEVWPLSLPQPRGPSEDTTNVRRPFSLTHTQLQTLTGFRASFWSFPLFVWKICRYRHTHT